MAIMDREMTAKTPKRPISKSEVTILILVLLAISLIWMGAWWWIDNYIISSTPSDSDAAVRGQFGDKFGAINALFSGFAFAGIIFTIFLQRRDLRETHAVMSHERFDNTFFQLLQVHITISDKLAVRGGFSGKQAFEAFNTHLKSCDVDFHAFCALQKLSRDQIRKIIDDGAISRELFQPLDESDISNLTESRTRGVSTFNNFLDTSISMHEQKIVSAYMKSASQYIDDFSHYFRNLYHILKFIEESSLISDTERNRYSRFVRAQLSQSELVAIFYNSISKISLPGRENIELGHPKMGRLLKKFDILQNLNPRNLIHPTHISIFDVNNSQGGANAN